MKDLAEQIKEKQALIDRLLTSCITNDQKHDLNVQKNLLEELTKGEG